MKGFSKKKLSLKANDITIKPLFFILLLFGRNQNARDIFQFLYTHTIKFSKRTMCCNLHITYRFCKNKILVGIMKCSSLIMKGNIDPVIYKSFIQVFMISAYHLDIYSRIFLRKSRYRSVKLITAIGRKYPQS